MFQHTSARRRTYGCSCGCGTCAGAYGSAYGEAATKWEPDGTYLTSCKEYKKQYDKWVKAYKQYQSLPAVLGIRTGPKVEKAVAAMKTAKVAGEAAKATCEGEEYQTLSAQITAAGSTGGGLTPEEILTVAGGGASQTGSDNTLLYVLGAAVVGVGGFLGYRVYLRQKARAAKKVAA